MYSSANEKKSICSILGLLALSNSTMSSSMDIPFNLSPRSAHILRYVSMILSVLSVMFFFSLNDLVMSSDLTYIGVARYFFSRLCVTRIFTFQVPSAFF